MQKRIFKTIAILTITVSLIVFFASAYILFYKASQNTMNTVQNETKQIASVLNENPNYLENNTVLTDSRITLISSTGEVIYDNTLDISNLDIHKDRPEVINAINDGYSSSIRKSDSIQTQLYYYAIKLNNGNVIRLSQNTNTVWGIIIPQINLIVIATILILLLSLFIANWATKKIVEPINKLDLQNPLSNKVYPELTDLLLSLEENNKVKREFSANVSHELKTPLTSISGYAEIMANGISKVEDQKIFSQKIYDESQKLINKINDIIKVSKLDENKVEQDYSIINYKYLLEEIIQELKPNLSNKNITLETELQDVSGEAIRYIIHDALYNIIQNGIKYNKKNGKLYIILNQFNDKIYIRVKDTGIGINQDDIPRIFERFFRADRSHNSKIEGTGLGLAITKHSIALHNGTIDVYSKPNEGTVFEIILPKEKSSL